MKIQAKIVALAGATALGLGGAVATAVAAPKSAYPKPVQQYVEHPKGFNDAAEVRVVGGEVKCNVKLQTVTQGDVKVTVREELAPLVDELLRITEEKGYKLKKDSTGGYNCRFVRGSTTSISNHSYGRAIDLNWNDNPMGDKFVSDIPPAVVKVWLEHGFYWGGHYKSRADAMHFEYVAPKSKIDDYVKSAKKIGNAKPEPSKPTTQPPAPSKPPKEPTKEPTKKPTGGPTKEPTKKPTGGPTKEPTRKPLPECPTVIPPHVQDGRPVPPVACLPHPTCPVATTAEKPTKDDPRRIACIPRPTKVPECLPSVVPAGVEKSRPAPQSTCTPRPTSSPTATTPRQTTLPAPTRTPRATTPTETLPAPAPTRTGQPQPTTPTETLPAPAPTRTGQPHDTPVETPPADTPPSDTVPPVDTMPTEDAPADPESGSPQAMPVDDSTSTGPELDSKSAGEGLADTGADDLTGLIVGGVALLGGGVALLVRRRAS